MGIYLCFKHDQFSSVYIIEWSELQANAYVQGCNLYDQGGSSKDGIHIGKI